MPDQVGSPTLAEQVAALRAGDRVRVEGTDFQGRPFAVEGTYVKHYNRVDAGNAIVHMDGCRHGITSVRVITPVLPPEPPVGAGWFTEDGVLWQRSTLDPADVGSDIPGPWHAVIDGAWALRAWSDIQPGRPAVPAGGDE